MPNLETVGFRSDNVGCDHSALSIANARNVGKEYGVKVQRTDFSTHREAKEPATEKRQP